jgi:hypothetical protein
MFSRRQKTVSGSENLIEGRKSATATFEILVNGWEVKNR